MTFIIMDLEWNNAYYRKIDGFMNEIIEIGAVKLNEHLQQVDTFSLFIKAQLGKRLRSRVKELTNITNADLSTGVPFTNAMAQFRRWCGDDTVTLTWGDTDIRVLIENFRYFNGVTVIPFLENYVNLQKYAQAFMNIEHADQIGLSAAAEKLGLNLEDYSLHRALDDSLLTVDIFRKIYNPQMLGSYTLPCGEEFYSKITFKARMITDINNPLVDQSKMIYYCDACGVECERVSDWRVVNKAFRAIFRCPECGQKVRFMIRFKEYYDRVDIKSSAVPFIEKKKLHARQADETEPAADEAEELL